MTAAARTLATEILGLVAWTLATSSASAQYRQYRDDYGDIRQTVARISYISGSASFSRGDDPDHWQSADRNVPMTLGDRIYTGDRSRLELQIHGGAYVRLGARSDLAALNLTDDTKQFSLKVGVASFRVRRLDPEEVFEVDTPNAAVTFDSPGDYRVDVDWDGNTRIGIRRGQATVAAGGGQVGLRAGEEMDVDGIDSPRYDVVRLGPPDGWDRFVADREARIERGRSYQYVSADVVGVDDLDEYGRWEDVPEYGRVWTPVSVEAGWAPYRAGHWVWQDPWGWTWVSGEPWGWAPYHYGRWVVYSSRWYWVPVAPAVRYVTYSPALVAFVGGGPGWSASVGFGGGGYVGWFPLGPRDPLNPWWGGRDSVNVTNVTYVNRTYVTVVNHDTFVSGSLVERGVIRDPVVVRQVVSSPVARGPISLVPTTASLRVAVRTDLAAPSRPPAQIIGRSVVARIAPPPAPPTFEAKMPVIRETRGAPVAPAAAAEIAVRDRGRPQANDVVRPAAAESGRVVLSPRDPNTSAPRPQPVAPVRDRQMATSQAPVAAPVVAPAPPARQREAPPQAAPQVNPGPGEVRQDVQDVPRRERPASPEERRNERARAPAEAPRQPAGAAPQPQPTASPAAPAPDRGRERPNAAPEPQRENRPAERAAPEPAPPQGRERQPEARPSDRPAEKGGEQKNEKKDEKQNEKEKKEEDRSRKPD